MSHLHDSWVAERRVMRLAKSKLTGFLRRNQDDDDEKVLEDAQEMFNTWGQLERIVAER